MAVEIRFSEDYLAHHGIKGQRWYIRRFQNPDGTLTPAGRKRYYVDEYGELQKYNHRERKEVKTIIKTRKEQARAERENAREAEKAELEIRKAENDIRKAEIESVKNQAKQAAENAKADAKKIQGTPEEIQATKQRMINSLDLKEIQKHQAEFTTNELQDVITRYEKNTKLSELTAEKKSDGEAELRKLSSVLGTSATAIQNGTNLYNNTAKVLNSLAGTNLKLIKDIDGGTKKSAFKGKDLEKILNNLDSYSDSELNNISTRLNTMDNIKKKAAGM